MADKRMLNHFYEEVNAGNLDVIDDVIAEDFVEHEDFPGISPDKEGVRQFFTTFRAAFPDMHMESHEVLADGDLLCCRSTMSGTQEGEFMGMPPTGKHFEVTGFDLLRVRGDQVTEHWGVMDSMKMMQQLGAIPEQAPA